MLRTKVVQIIERLQEFVKRASEQKRRYCYRKGDFSKAVKLPFIRVALLNVNFLKRSLSVEIDEFFTNIDHLEQVCTKSAFCQARQKIRPVFFKVWNEHLVDSYFEVAQGTEKRWRGLKVHAVDGMKVYLPQTDDIFTAFGGQTNQFGKTAMAMTVCQYDVLNDLLIEGHMGAYKSSEQYHAGRILSNVSTDTLMLYDRNFPGFELIYDHFRRGIPFLMRCKASFNKEVKAFVESGRDMAIVQFYATEDAIAGFAARGIRLVEDTSVNVRLVRIELPNGELEVLITSLMDEDLTLEDFKQLYFMRWSEETCFDRLKNKMQLEVFSSLSAHGIEQDFYAILFACNLHSIIVKACDENVAQISKGREHPYEINRNVTVGLLKRRLPELFLSQKPEIILEELILLFSKKLEPVRPQRTFLRTTRQRKMNGRFYTELAFKRAI